MGALSGLTGCSTAAPHAQPPKLAAMSSTEKDRLNAVHLNESWTELVSQFPNAEKPNPVPTRVRYVTLDDWPQANASCLTDQGFAATVSPDGGVGTHVAPGQEEASALATYVCDVEYPIDPKFNEPLVKSQLAYLYSYYVSELTPCLQKAGFSVPDAPSLQTFEDTYNSSNPWAPYAEVKVSGDKMTRINKECPQTPTGLYGY
jgi:hypothetical protein